MPPRRSQYPITVTVHLIPLLSALACAGAARGPDYGDSALISAASAMRSAPDTILIPGTKSIGARLRIVSYTNQIGYVVIMPASIRPAPRALCSSLAKAKPVTSRAEAGPHSSPLRWLGGAPVRPPRKSRAGGYADRPPGPRAREQCDFSDSSEPRPRPASTRPAATRLPGDCTARLVRP